MLSNFSTSENKFPTYLTKIKQLHYVMTKNKDFQYIFPTYKLTVQSGELSFYCFRNESEYGSSDRSNINISCDRRS